MGAARVGKSSLITQFLYGKFSSKYKRTVEEMHHGQFTVDGVKIDLDILDTSGAYEFPAMRALSISSADAFVLVYSVTDPETFQQASAIRDQIIDTKRTAGVPIVVVGNKLDLANTDRKVSRDRRDFGTFTRAPLAGEDGQSASTETSGNVPMVERSKNETRVLSPLKIRQLSGPVVRSGETVRVFVRGRYPTRRYVTDALTRNRRVRPVVATENP